jgi:hypothetical protein
MSQTSPYKAPLMFGKDAPHVLGSARTDAYLFQTRHFDFGEKEYFYFGLTELQPYLTKINKACRILIVLM